MFLNLATSKEQVIKIMIKKILSICLLVPLSYASCMGQPEMRSKESQDSLYMINILKSRIDGVYIPKDLEEAMDRLRELTPEASLTDFSREEEREVCRKLHFGIGRWMIANWKFYEGSRLSHHLLGEGLLHPDDMAQFILRMLHRSLNGNPLDKAEVIAELQDFRRREAERLIDDQEIIKRTKKEKPPDKKGRN